MRTWIYSLLIMATCCIADWAQAQKIDSSYANWYYQVRDELYKSVADKKVDIVFVGNSITERGDWNELIPGKKVANRGIGGDNSFGVLARLDPIIQQQPSTVFLMIGINDIGRGLPVEVILNNYQRIIAKLRSGLPKATIYVQSVLPLNEQLLNYDYLKKKNATVLTLNELLKQLAAKNKLMYINLHEVMADANGELKKEYTKDGIHLKTEAYLAWVNYLKAKKYL